MSNRRSQLKEQISKTEDPLIRLQLQQLLDGRKTQHNKGIRKIEDILDSLSRQIINKLPASAVRVIFLVIITIILFILFMVLECRA